MKMIALTLAGLIGLMGISGCEPMEEERPAEPTPAPTQPGEPAEPTAPPEQPQPDEPLGIERSDQEIAQEVQTRIQEDVQLSPNDRSVTVSVEDGRVTLSGHVQSEQESQQIEQTAADVVGQQNVDNQLEIQDQQQQLDQQPQQPQQQDLDQQQQDFDQP